MSRRDQQLFLGIEIKNRNINEAYQKAVLSLLRDLQVEFGHEDKIPEDKEILKDLYEFQKKASQGSYLYTRDPDEPKILGRHLFGNTDEFLRDKNERSRIFFPR